MARFSARLWLIVTCTLVLASCAALDGTKRLKDPVITDVVESGTTKFITQSGTSDRRLIIFKDGKVCPEAPPDTASNISAAYSAAVKANASAAKDTTGAGGSLSMSDQLATALNHVVNPAQGTLMMRYGVSAVCIAYINGAIDETAYATFLGSWFETAAKLTAAELEANKGQVGNNEVPVQQTAPALTGAKPDENDAAKAAGDATAKATKDKGKEASDGAAKKASDAVKAQAPKNATPAQLAATTGAATFSTVLQQTNSPDKAQTASAAAIASLLDKHLASTTIPISTNIAAPGNGALAVFAQSVTNPFVPSRGATGSVIEAARYERLGFQALLERNAALATTNFDLAFATYPEYHNVDEIRAYLKEKQSSLANVDSAAWKDFYATILSRWPWGAPSGVLEQMKAQLH